MSPFPFPRLVQNRQTDHSYRHSTLHLLFSILDHSAKNIVLSLSRAIFRLVRNNTLHLYDTTVYLGIRLSWQYDHEMITEAILNFSKSIQLTGNVAVINPERFMAQFDSQEFFINDLSRFLKPWIDQKQTLPAG